MQDWFDPIQESYNSIKTMENKDLTELFKLARQKIYANVCLRIVYQFFYECEFDRFRDIETAYFDSLASNESVNSSDFHVEMLKILVTHLLKDVKADTLEKYKQKVENVTKTFSDKAFFDLAFLLHENNINQFEQELKTYLNQKDDYGDFHQLLVTPNLRLLVHIMKWMHLDKAILVLSKKVPFIEYNSTILTSFKETQQFQRFIVKPFKNQIFEKVVIF